MSKKIGLQAKGPNIDPLLYMEVNSGASYSIGVDNLTDSLCVNALTTAGATPDEATAQIAVNPAPTGDIDFFPNRNSVFLQGDVDIAAGNLLFANTPGTDGQIPISATGGNPEWASLTAGANITITPGANSIEIAAAGASGTPIGFTARLASQILNFCGMSGNSPIIPFDTVDYNEGLGFDLPTSTFTVPAGGKGIYAISAGAGINGWTLGEIFYVWVSINGTSSYEGIVVNPQTLMSAGSAQSSVTFQLLMDVGDTLGAYVFSSPEASDSQTLEPGGTGGGIVTFLSAVRVIPVS